MRELIGQLREAENIFQPVDPEALNARKMQALALLKAKYKPGKTVSMFGTFEKPDWRGAYTRYITGTIRAFHPGGNYLKQFKDAPLTIDNFTVDVHFPELGYILMDIDPSDLEIIRN